MATSVWHEDPGGDRPPEDHRSRGPASSAENLRQMQVLRRFVAEVLEEQGGNGSSVLSEDEWLHLCEAAGSVGSDEDAIARLVMRAYGRGAATVLPAFGVGPPESETPNPQVAPPPQEVIDQTRALDSAPGQVLDHPGETRLPSQDRTSCPSHSSGRLGWALLRECPPRPNPHRRRRVISRFHRDRPLNPQLPLRRSRQPGRAVPFRSAHR